MAKPFNIDEEVLLKARAKAEVNGESSCLYGLPLALAPFAVVSSEKSNRTT